MKGKSKTVSKRPRETKDDSRPPERVPLSAEERKESNRRLGSLLQTMRETKPDVCEWLSKEEYFLPEVVNLVYMVSFESPYFSQPLDMVRMAQYLPNTKHRPPSNASITIRLYPSTAILFMRGNMLLIKTTSPSEALYNSHLYRQLVEQIPFILKNKGDPEDKLYVGTLEGKLGLSKGRVENVVGNGILYQEGVHLTNLMHAEDEFVEWEPDTFPNLIYRGSLSDGSRFCANIAVTGKVVLMGLRTIEGLYEAYKIVCDLVYDFEDPNVPKHPKGRYDYRLKQLFNNRVLSSALEDTGNDLHTWLDPEDILETQPELVDQVAGNVPNTSDLPPQVDENGDPKKKQKTTINSDPEEARANSVYALMLASTPKAPLTERQRFVLRDKEYAATVNLVGLATELGRVEMLEFLLREGGSLARGVWQPGDAEGRLPIDMMKDSRDPKHKQIMHILRRYSTKYCEVKGEKL